MKPELARSGDEIGIAIVIDVGDQEFDDQVVCRQALPLVRSGEPDGKFVRVATGFDPVANAIAVEIGPQRIRLGQIWSQ